MSGCDAPQTLKDVKATRRRLGDISEAGLYRIVRRGELPVVKIGRRTFFRTEDLDAFVERNVRSRGSTTEASADGEPAA